MTNADCIRRMNDEQLYEFLSEWECGDIDYSVTFCDLCNEATKRGEVGNVLNLDCDGCRKHWLQRDAVDYGGLMYWKKNTTFDTTADRKTEPSIDIIRCKDCDNYAGEGMYCAWDVLTGDMGYCHHARPKGSTDITAEQTEPTVSKMEQVDKDINVRSKDEPMKTADYCDICKRDMCEVCIADATNPYCVPSHYEINYEPKDEPQTHDLHTNTHECVKTNADQRIQSVESVGSVEQTEREGE